MTRRADGPRGRGAILQPPRPDAVPASKILERARQRQAAV